ncbi:N-acylmannosamine kinase [Spirochaetia bacterium]|nr:N-acylmannosamine kinase [Spirochaetia bacterium]
MILAGIDIGGTKCRLSLGDVTAGGVEFLHKGVAHATADCTPDQMLNLLLGDFNKAAEKLSEKPAAIGISCGGPLDQKRGIILSPPNLPDWDAIHVTEFFTRHTGIPAFLQNDADAGALAEWQYGAGKGCKTIIFITFGTGCGSGLILDNRLYSGASGCAGEIGHVRIAEYGPPGYGKLGSMEGYCSGGGIARLSRFMVEAELQKGRHPAFCPAYADLDSLSAKTVGIAAEQGDPLALKIYSEVGKKLGAGLAILIDILNPEMIILGSIFKRSRNELWPDAQAIIEQETLPLARAACKVVPAALGEEIGDYAAIAVAEYGRNRQ